jgi:hypothetical protein
MATLPMATQADRYSSFFDPFAKGNVVGPSKLFPEVEALSSLHIDAPPPYTTPANNVISIVSALAPSPQDPNEAPSLAYEVEPTRLAIRGQGTVVANCTGPDRLFFTFLADNGPEDPQLAMYALYAEIADDSVKFWYGPAPPDGASAGFQPGDRVAIPGNLVNDPQSNKAPSNLRPTFLHQHQEPARYWMSVDHKNGVLRFGRDYVNLSLALYEANMKEVKNGVERWIDEKVCI